MEELKLTFVNVGYGEAALLECPDPAFPGGTFVMVIDGGSAEAEEYRDSATGRIPLDQYLSLRGVDHIDLMAATHVHEDHLCGLLPAAEKLPPAALWQTLPPEFCRSMRTLDIPAEGLTPSRSKFLRALNDYRRLCLGQSCPRHRPLAGMELRLCRDLLVRVLGPSRAQAEKLASSCRALYEEADPSAFWQRLDQLDVAMNNYSLILTQNARFRYMTGNVSNNRLEDTFKEHLDIIRPCLQKNWDEAAEKMLYHLEESKKSTFQLIFDGMDNGTIKF